MDGARPQSGAHRFPSTLKRAVANPAHLAALRDAVERVHACTYHATDPLNLYVRDRLERHEGTGPEGVFTQNWLLNAYYTASVGKGRAPKGDANIQAVFDAHMRNAFVPPMRTGLTQALMYECTNLAAVGSTNAWKHFQKRVSSYTRTAWALDEAAYAALSGEERRARKLALMQAASDGRRRSSLVARSTSSARACTGGTTSPSPSPPTVRACT